ncbi:MAG: hypothetical protein ACI89X_000310 [Planctomycetota bacterium]|jgi:hypothetical protein
MRKRLYLHIGHPKAASTAIQTALAQHIDTLRAQGFLVADSNFEFPEEGPLDGAPVQYVADMCERKEAGLKEALAKFHELGSRLGDRFDKVIVSSESLCIPEAEYLASALRHEFEIHVIYYIRRQDDWVISAWNQWGCQEGETLVEFCERLIKNSYPNFKKVLSRWQPVANSVHVKPLHASAFASGGVLADFFAAIGANIEIDERRPANASMDLALLEVFASSEFLFESVHDKRIVKWLRAMQPADYPVEKPTLSAELQTRVREHFAAENRELHQQFFADLDYDELFGPRKDEQDILERHTQQSTPEAEMNRMRRIIGLQFDLLQKMHVRLKKLEG